MAYHEPPEWEERFRGTWSERSQALKTLVVQERDKEEKPRLYDHEGRPLAVLREVGFRRTR